MDSFTVGPFRTENIQVTNTIPTMTIRTDVIFTGSAQVTPLSKEEADWQLKMLRAESERLQKEKLEWERLRMEALREQEKVRNVLSLLEDLKRLRALLKEKAITRMMLLEIDE